MKNKLPIVFISILLLIPNVSAQIPVEGLVAAYLFDGDTLDESGLDNHASIHGDAAFTTNRFGIPESALKFDGINDSVICSSDPRGISGEVVVSAWIRTTSQNFHCIAGKYSPTEDKGFILYINNGCIKLQGRNNSGRHILVGPSRDTINDGNWHHVVGRIDGNLWETWIDFNLQCTYITEADTPDLSNNEPLFIGCYLEFPPFEGDIDDIRMYNRALDYTEMASLYCDSMCLRIFEIFDTITVYDTLTLYDTISIMDTITIYDTLSYTLFDTVSVTDTLILDLSMGIYPIQTESKIKIYPNPSSDILHIDILGYGEIMNYQLRLFDMSGNTIFERTIHQDHYSFDLSAITEPGIYNLVLTDQNFNLVAIKKIVIK